MNIWNILVSLVFLGHGIGHITGFLTAWTKIPVGFNDQPWIFSRGVTIKSPIGKLFGLVWLAAGVAFIFSAYLLYTRQVAWAGTAITASILSFIAIIPWWNTVVPGAKYGGNLANLVTLIGLFGPWGFQIIDWLAK